jgi:nucleotide-binding universal stress UspA family protein
MTMIADVMVHLTGTPAGDDTRLAAAETVAGVFNSHIIGLFLNELPLLIPEEGGGVGTIELINRARDAGDEIEQQLVGRLSRLKNAWEIHRHDVIGEAAAADQASREARAADAFIASRPNGEPKEPARLSEAVIFGSGRHVILVHENMPLLLRRIVVAWNGSREGARALAEALPYLKHAESVSVVCVVERDAEWEATIGTDAVRHLNHHDIEAKLHHVKENGGNVGTTLLDEARRLRADLIVVGGYGHSRLREWLLGGVTYKLLHESPIPLLVAH